MTSKQIKQGCCPFHSQPFAEQFTLWAVRLWVQAFSDETTADEILLDAFTRAGVPHGYDRLDDLMSIISCGAARTIRINDPCTSEISADEKSILRILARIQLDDSYDPSSDLQRFLKPSGARVAGEKAKAFASALMAGQIQLSAGEHLSFDGLGSRLPGSAPGSQLIH
jgi:hypothetical protein